MSEKCRCDKKYAVISFSSALATYDLKKGDLDDILVLSETLNSLEKTGHLYILLFSVAIGKRPIRKSNAD